MEEMSELALVDVFEPMPDSRRKPGEIGASFPWGTGSKVRLEETVGCRGFAILQYHQAHLAGTRACSQSRYNDLKSVKLGDLTYPMRSPTQAWHRRSKQLATVVQGP
ncbi:MAG: hypothetical protein BRC44_11360 [Cyanobacteria bacterium QS_4_48_99]|nr:MAG: hypothetical protein BRC44_11360 [Cyanobacteria bacterium QS_4_48_99]